MKKLNRYELNAMLELLKRDAEQVSKEKHIENIKAMQEALNIEGMTEEQKTGEPL